MDGITRRGMVGAAIMAMLMVLLTSGTAFADGGRTLTFDSPEGQPQSGMPTTLVVRLVEGEHLVAGAQVFVAVTPTGVGSPPNAGAVATPGNTPGEYVVSVDFPEEGTWRVWLMAEEGGEHTMSAYEVDVASVAGTSGSGATGMEGMDHGAGATAVEPMEGMSHSDGSAAVSAAEGDGHSESESAAAGHGGGGGVNWWVISAFLAVIAAGVIGAVGLKARLRRQIALGELAPEGACDV